MDYLQHLVIFLLFFLVINQIIIKHLYILNLNQTLIFLFNNLLLLILNLLQVILMYIINEFLLQIQNYILIAHNLLKHQSFFQKQVLKKNVVYDFFLIILMKSNKMLYLHCQMKSLTFFMVQ